MGRAYLIRPVPFRVWITVLIAAAEKIWVGGYSMKACLSMLAFCIFLGAGSLGVQNSAAEAANGKEMVRFGFVQEIVGVINENDVTVAIRVWIKSLTKEMSIPVEVTVSIYTDLSEIKTDLEENRVDVIYITTPHLFVLESLVAEDALLTAKQSGSVTEEYLLVVHQDSPANDGRDLKGKNLRVLDNARTSLSLNWLNVFLSQNGLGRPGAHFKKYDMVNKINEAVLPVFFKRADACLVTRKGFDVMAELNPQISRQMKILAISASYIPTVLGFRKTYQSSVKQMVMKNFQKMIESSSGSQLLTIFQNDGMQQISKGELADTISLLKKDHSLSGVSESGRAVK